ncbi:MAG TPA: phosphatase PAP2 family protein [Sphingomonas sp.]|nr:phosphatase PAP2 family protein [Sphingomonas sp.]
MSETHLPEAQGADAAGVVPRAVRQPPALIWAAGAAAFAVLILVVLGWTIDRGHRFAFDRALLLAFRQPGDLALPVGPHWLEHAMIDLTAMGGGTVLTIAVVATLGALAVERLWLTAGLVVAATVSGSLAVDLAKHLVARARPDIVPHLVEVSSMSFPSGHSANSAIVWLTLATLLTQVIPNAALRRYVLAVAMLLVAAIGVSRVYLGVHWPSDVLAGWSFGALWALGWWAVGARIRLARAGE